MSVSIRYNDKIKKPKNKHKDELLFDCISLSSKDITMKVGNIFELELLEDWIHERKKKIDYHSQEVKKNIKKRYITTALFLIEQILDSYIYETPLKDSVHDLTKDDSGLAFTRTWDFLKYGHIFSEITEYLFRSRDTNSDVNIESDTLRNRYFQLFDFATVLLQEYSVIWDEVVSNSPDVLDIQKISSDMNTVERRFFLSLLERDSPGTYKAIQKGIDSGRIIITPEGKLDFQFIKKGTLAHIFKTGGYTEWARLSCHVLIDGKEITGSLKNLAASEPPKGFEEIKRELYPN